jgi:hypothetical protein
MYTFILLHTFTVHSKCTFECTKLVLFADLGRSKTFKAADGSPEEGKKHTYTHTHTHAVSHFPSSQSTKNGPREWAVGAAA